MDVAYPEHPHDASRPATAYVRPHELDIHRQSMNGSSIRASVVRINSMGAAVRIGLADDAGEALNVELNRERFAELALEVGETVWVAPRKVRVFIHDFQI